MEILKIEAFPIPIMIGKLDVPESLNELLVEDCLDAVDKYPPTKRSGVGVTQSMVGLESVFQSFITLSDDHLCLIIGKYIEWATGNHHSFDIKNMWANVNRDSAAFHMPHSHSFRDGTFSGVYYPTNTEFAKKTVKENVASRSQPPAASIVFLDPLEGTKTGLATEKTSRYPYFGNPICFTPMEGSFALFPNYLSHLVTPTGIDATRISIAYDIELFDE